MSCTACIKEGLRKAFSFHLPFQNEKRPFLKFWRLILVSFFVNALAIAILWLCDEKGWLDRSDWTGEFGVNQRTQTRGDAGCEFAADDRTNYLAQPVTALSSTPPPLPLPSCPPPNH